MSDAINPKHYQDHLRIPKDRISEFIDESSGDLVLQWIHKMEFTLSPEEFQGLLKGQSDKYMSRLGQKDQPSQETGKAAWYINYITGWFKRNGR